MPGLGDTRAPDLCSRAAVPLCRRLVKPAQMRSERIGQQQSFDHSGYNLLTGQEVSKKNVPF